MGFVENDGLRHIHRNPQKYHGFCDILSDFGFTFIAKRIGQILISLKWTLDYVNF